MWQGLKFSPWSKQHLSLTKLVGSSKDCCLLYTAAGAPVSSPANPTTSGGTPATPAGTPGSKTTPASTTQYSDGSVNRSRVILVILVAAIVVFLDHFWVLQYNKSYCSFYLFQTMSSICAENCDLSKVTHARSRQVDGWIGRGSFIFTHHPLFTCLAVEMRITGSLDEN